MMRWVFFSVFVGLLHTLLLIGNFHLPAIFQIKPFTPSPIQVVWVKHLQDISIEPKNVEDPLEHARAITEDLLKQGLGAE